ncbi:MAG: hypothetical protein WAW92_01650 [Minisyncoccia bacterium]
MILDFIKKYADYLSVSFLAVLSFSLNYFPKNLTEFDNLFHLASGSLYRERGLFFNDFRWESYSIFGEYMSDIWYGFHLIISIFTTNDNYELSGKIATAFLTFILLVSFYFVLRKLNVKYALFCTVFLIFSSIGEIIRMTDLRPQIIISGLIVLFFYYLAWEKNNKALFVISLLFTFIEVSMIWLPVSIFVFYWLGQNLSKFFRLDWRGLYSGLKIYFISFAWIISGLVIGSFLRPGPISGLYLTYYQIVYLFGVKLSGVVLPWGTELYRLNKDGFASLLPLLFITLITFAVWFTTRSTSHFTERENEFIFATYFQAFVFTLIAIFVANRSSDILSIFSVLALAITFPYCYTKIPEKIQKKITNRIIFVFFFFTFFYGGLLSLIFYHNVYGRDVDSYRDTAEYLMNNTEAGSVVAHLNFNEYSGLFLWNKHNVYQNHSDPIFEYAYNPKVYSQFLCGLVDIGAKEDIYSSYVSDEEIANYCQKYERRDLLKVIKEDMAADYIFIGENKPIRVIKYLLSQRKVKLLYSGKSSLVFEIE